MAGRFAAPDFMRTFYWPRLFGRANADSWSRFPVIAKDRLRAIGRALHAWVIPEQASIPEAWKHFDDDGNVKDSDLEARVRKVGQQVARFAFLHTSDKSQQLLAAWEGAPSNPGGGNELG